MAKSFQILLEILYSVVNGDVAIRQQTLELSLAHSGQAARSSKGQALLLEQRQGEFPFQLQLSNVSCVEDFVRNRKWHSRCFYYTPSAKQKPPRHKCVERALVVCRGPEVRPSDFSFQFQTNGAPTGRTLEDVEPVHIERILREASHNLSRAARILDIDRTTLYNKLRRYGLK